jgi:hypothetical protein
VFKVLCDFESYFANLLYFLVREPLEVQLNGVVSCFKVIDINRAILAQRLEKLPSAWRGFVALFCKRGVRCFGSVRCARVGILECRGIIVCLKSSLGMFSEKKIKKARK